MNSRIIDLYNNIDKNIADKAYLNFGFWKNANTVEKACEAMIDLVISAADFYDGCRILDVGFGYGTQDIYIHRKFPLSKIVGINIVQKQIDYANKKLKENGLEGHIEYINEDATNITFPEKSFDRIVAIESAFHFNTREYFLRKAYDTLEDNGILCLADTTQDLELLKRYDDLDTILAYLGAPRQNMMDECAYRESLEDIGFKKIEFINISEYVIPYAAIIVNSANGWRTKEMITLSENRQFLEQAILAFKHKVLYHNYFIIKAIK